MKRKKSGKKTSRRKKDAGDFPSHAPRPVSRNELIIAGGVIVLGVLLRTAFPSRMAIEHFDEGVYASNVWFPAGFGYPLREFYGPPLLPQLIETSLWWQTRPGDLGAVAPSLLAAFLTLPLAWWIARNWFGPAAALATVTLAALSDFHMLYSRMALTDALVVLLMLLAIWLIERVLTTGSLLYVLLTGLTTGLAFWTKYNGWLPLAIGLAGGAAYLVIHRPARPAAGRYLLHWCVIAAVAALVAAPVIYQLQPVGGYLAVSENHQKYVVGAGGWLESFLRQADTLRHFSGSLTCTGLALAVAFAGLWMRKANDPESSPSANHWRLIGVAAVALLVAGCGAWLGAGGVLLPLSLMGLANVFSSAMSGRPQDETRSLPGVCLLAAWCLSLFVATPLYHPYPRLALPWLVGTWIAAGAGAAALVRFEETTGDQLKSNGKPYWRRAVALAAGAGLLLAAWPTLIQRGAPAWQARTSMKDAAKQISAEAQRIARDEQPRSDSAPLAFVYGEPALFFQLRAAGMPDVYPIAGLGVATRAASEERGKDVFVVVGPNGLRGRQFQEELQSAGDSLELLESYPFAPSGVVLRNFSASRQADEAQSLRREEIQLYRVRVAR